MEFFAYALFLSKMFYVLNYFNPYLVSPSPNGWARLACPGGGWARDHNPRNWTGAWLGGQAPVWLTKVTLCDTTVVCSLGIDNNHDKDGATNWKQGCCPFQNRVPVVTVGCSVYWKCCHRHKKASGSTLLSLGPLLHWVLAIANDFWWIVALCPLLPLADCACFLSFQGQWHFLHWQLIGIVIRFLVRLNNNHDNDGTTYWEWDNKLIGIIICFLGRLRNDHHNDRVMYRELDDKLVGIIVCFLGPLLHWVPAIGNDFWWVVSLCPLLDWWYCLLSWQAWWQ